MTQQPVDLARSKSAHPAGSGRRPLALETTGPASPHGLRLAPPHHDAASNPTASRDAEGEPDATATAIRRLHPVTTTPQGATEGPHPTTAVPSSRVAASPSPAWGWRPPPGEACSPHAAAATAAAA